MRATIVFALAASLLAAGCATTEHRYAARDLPAPLQASAWPAPCALDLSLTAAGRCQPKLDCGDEIEVVLASGLSPAETTRIQATIADDGTVDLPLLGRIAVAGETAESARQAVVQACHRDGVNGAPYVQISLRQPRQARITVTGAVQHPGIYTLPRQSSDLVSALAAAGGMSRDAGYTVIIQSRKTRADGKGVADLVSAEHRNGQAEPALLLHAADTAGDRREIRLTSATAESLAAAQLKDGDVVAVERRDPPAILVTGMVQKPGRYELPLAGEFRVLDAVASAQGVTHKVIDTVLICRAISGDSKRVVIQVSLRDATRDERENILLMPGDIVSVETNARMLFQDVTKYVGVATMALAGMVIHF